MEADGLAEHDSLSCVWLGMYTYGYARSQVNSMEKYQQKSDIKFTLFVNFFLPAAPPPYQSNIAVSVAL